MYCFCWIVFFDQPPRKQVTRYNPSLAHYTTDLCQEVFCFPAQSQWLTCFFNSRISLNRKTLWCCLRVKLPVTKSSPIKTSLLFCILFVKVL